MKEHEKRLLELVLSLGLWLSVAAPASAYDMGYVEQRQILTCGNSNTAFLKPDGALWGFGSPGSHILGVDSGICPRFLAPCRPRL